MRPGPGRRGDSNRPAQRPGAGAVSGDATEAEISRAGRLTVQKSIEKASNTLRGRA